jgi:hypothetical protein
MFPGCPLDVYACAAQQLRRISSSGRFIKTARTMIAQKRVGDTATFMSNEAAQRKAAVIMQDQVCPIKYQIT